jgi:hypothetical protein
MELLLIGLLAPNAPFLNSQAVENNIIGLTAISST